MGAACIVGVSVRPLGAVLGNINLLKYIFVLNICCQHFGGYMSVGGLLCTLPSGAGLGNVHFVTYIFVSDICGQHLGDICQLEVFCAPFGRRVRECIFFL